MGDMERSAEFSNAGNGSTSAQCVLVSQPVLDTWPQMPGAASGWACDTEQVRFSGPL